MSNMTLSNFRSLMYKDVRGVSGEHKQARTRNNCEKMSVLFKEGRKVSFGGWIIKLKICGFFKNVFFCNVMKHKTIQYTSLFYKVAGHV